MNWIADKQQAEQSNETQSYRCSPVTFACEKQPLRSVARLNRLRLQSTLDSRPTIGTSALLSATHPTCNAEKAQLKLNALQPLWLVSLPS
jgi:hypothetical protein